MSLINREALIAAAKMLCEGCCNCNGKLCCVCEVQGMLDLIEDQPTVEQPRWVPVTERLPEVVKTKRAHRNVYRESGRVLCACLQADGKRLVKEGYMYFFNDYLKPTWAIPGTIHSVTHWQPLPEPPKED